MIEVVFSSSAGGSLEAAIEAGIFDAQTSDVLVLPLYLHIGNIRERDFWEDRVRTLEYLFGVYPDTPGLAKEMVTQAHEDLKAFEKRIIEGEAVRIWTSRSPEDASGYVWFAGHLNALSSHGEIVSVHLPWFEEREDGTIVLRSGCSELDAECWQELTNVQMRLPNLMCAMMQYEWQKLAQESAPLRALINGRLMSVPPTFYDFLIVRELDSQPETFNEAVAIGRLLGEYQLGISDAWLALRIAGMVQAGWLEEVEPAPSDGPTYHRILRKTPAFSDAVLAAHVPF